MKEGWEIKKLGDCFDSIKNGATIKQERGAIGIPITRIETLSGGNFNRDRLGYANIESTEKYASFVLDDGDLLLSHINSKTYIGRTVVYNKLEGEEIIHGMNLLRMKANRNIVSPSYIYYCFKSDLFRIQIATYRKDAVNQSSIPVSDLKKINIPIPPLSEQERIVTELDLISGVIEKKKQQLKELDSLAQSIFYEMFGNPVENEKGWEREKLSNKAEISSSKRIFASEYTDSGVPFYRGKEVTEKSKGNPISVELYISHERYEEIKLNYGVPDVGDILVTAVGTIGNIWVVDSDDVFYFKDGNVLWIKIKDGTNPIYFKYILTILINEYKDMMANGCAYSALTIANLKEMPTCVIPLSLQQEFASKVEKIEKQKELIKQSLAETETLFNSRMDFYFN